MRRMFRGWQDGIAALGMASVALLALSAPARAETIESAYTDLDCSVFDLSVEGGEFATFTCNGHLGYPVQIYTGDLRESVFYGYPPAGDHVFESFAAFNGVSGKIEWRILVDGERRIPFATIHRWTVNEDPEDPQKKTEVLVVEKVGLIDAREGCAVGYVVATGNARANETARRIADEQVRDFACGADEPVQVEGAGPVPAFTRN